MLMSPLEFGFRLLAALCVLTLATGPATAQRRGDCQGAVATGWHGTMVPKGEPGETLRVTGKVLGSSGDPVAGVNVFAYQTDAAGYYSPGGANEGNARLCAVVRTNERGEYSLDTIRPGSYPSGGVPSHIHFELWTDGIARQRQDLQFADDGLVPDRRKANLTRTSTVRPVDRDEDGVWHVERDFRLR